MNENERKRLTFEREFELPQAIEYLEELVWGLKTGQVTVEQDGRTLTIQPGTSVTLKLKVRQKRDREAILFELRWRSDVRADGRVPSRVTDRPELEPAS